MSSHRDVQRVLVFPGGTEIGLEIQRSLHKIRSIELLSAGSSDDCLAPHVFREHHRVASVGDGPWVEELNSVIDRAGVDLVYPAHDDVVLCLAERASDLRARVIGSPLETCKVARSKRLTYAELRDVVAVPHEIRGLRAINEFPLFIKPDRGEGSRGACRVDTMEELDARMKLSAEGATRFWDDNVVTEYLPGAEYTVDCFTTSTGELLFAGPRVRLKARSGIAVHSRIVDDNGEFRRIAQSIAEKVAFVGAWFFQVKRRASGELVLMEMAPRIAGTMGLHRARGVNLPLLSVFDALGMSVRVLENDAPNEVVRMLRSRYAGRPKYRRVYIDLDDTLLHPNGVDCDAVSFVYQCINKSIPVCLVTRHSGDLHATLRQHRLDGLFDSVEWLDPTRSKADVIDPDGAIFIDDSYRERADVASRLAIPTYDLSMLEVLRD